MADVSIDLGKMTPEASEDLYFAKPQHSKKPDKIARCFRKLDEIGEKATEKFIYLKDIAEKNKGQTAYTALTAGVGVSSYALIPNIPFLPRILLSSALSTITIAACEIYDFIKHGF